MLASAILYTNAIFTIAEWTIIINKAWDQWGAYNYDEALDAVRLTVKPQVSDSLYERMQFKVLNSGAIQFNWEKVSWDFIVEPI